MSSWNFEKCCFFVFLALFCGASTSLTSEMTPPTSQPCPKDCVCSGNPDALRVDCSNLNLTSVPPDIGPMTSILDLSWNNIRELNDGEFARLTRLQELNMANNHLEIIPETAFLKLSTLRTLHLQNNRFRSIPSLSFASLVNLENLYLSYNNIDIPTEDTFALLPRLQKLWLDGTNLIETPVKSLLPLTKLEALNLASNNIRIIPDNSFQNLKKLAFLYLQNNQIEYVGPNAFEGLVSLRVLEINGNALLDVPPALSALPRLRELLLFDNKIKFLPKTSFSSNPELTTLELSGNPIEAFHRSTFSGLPRLKKLTLSDVRLLDEFPDITGTSGLEHLRIDRANLNMIPADLCSTVPLLRSLNLKSNKLTEIPELNGCKELRLIDLSYNNILAVREHAFTNQGNLIDLFLSHNSISEITKDSFEGLTNLQVLDLESNEIANIDLDAFEHFKDLRDLNLGANKFPKLPTKGLQNLRQLKTFNNRELKEFPPVSTFPRINTLALSYAYHCCEFLAAANHRTSGPRASTSLQETIVWLSKEDVDMSSWNSNITDIYPDSSGNFSRKFEEFANKLWKAFGRDYTIPDNLAQYAEEYFEDYKALENPLARFALQCLPEPGPFMPCEDLFGWWSLRCGVWVVFLLALLGNGIVVIVLIIGRSKMDVPRFLVCNLAGADFFMGIYLGMLAVVDASTLGEFKVSAIKWQTSAGCQVAGFFGVLSSELSVFTLSVITLERNYAITHAMHLNKRLSLRHAGYIMLIGWTFACAMAALPLIGVSDYKKFAICLPFETEDVWSLSYVVFLILINGVAFLILMGCYLKMYCAIRGSQAWNSNDSRIARRMALLVFTDFLCWAPIAFFSLTAVCGLQLISLEEAKVFAIFVLPLNSCANPFLYAIFTKQFKKDCIHICKRIEESRVTRGIGRGRHSSNFSNRQTPVTTNSAAAVATPGSDSEQPPRCRNFSTDVCRCSNKTSWKSKDITREGWKEWALKYCLCRRQQKDRNDCDGYTYAIAQIQRNMEKRNKHTTSISSENFSSRSDSWRQGNIPLRLMDHETRRGSWSLHRKASEDSNMSCSRQDSSTSTFHMSRSSFSSDSSSQPRSTRPLLGSGISSNKDSFRTSRESKPRLCRQGAVSDERSITHNKHELPRHLIKEKNIDGLCPVCVRKEGFKSKELEEKFACFYNRLVESSCGETSDTFSSKEDQIVFLSENQSMGEKILLTPITKEATEIQRPHIEVNPMEDKGNVVLSIFKTENASENADEYAEGFSKSHFGTKDKQNMKSRSLMNINAKVINEKAKNSSSENSLIKLPVTSTSDVFKTLPSHVHLGKHLYDVETKLKMTNLRASKSENVVQKCCGNDDCSNLFTEFNFVINRSESAKTDLQSWNLLSTAEMNETKKSTSSPNITVKHCETSPLIDNEK
ncbi:leucine-rich repeat-containing G-protein coupled receptor 5-like isoform X1 [Argiope bruennichi]|nr:leucine-rich repeat-containing G-protein coupled receptor 5-like isoform X1 [Argiope bruennichi]